MKPQTYLVTGAAGFIGARFVESCAGRGIRIVSVDRPEHFRARPEHQGVEFGEIVDRERLIQWLAENPRPLSAVVHLGACTDTTELDEDYLRRVNLAYSQDLWSWCASHRVPLVYASSAATYGGGEKGYDDGESLIAELKPLNPYGESKRLFDLWALSREKSGIAPPHWAGFKFFNVYGFGERHKEDMASVVLKGFDQIRQTGELRLFKSYREGIRDGGQERDFIHVGDVVDVLHFALEKPLARGIFNLGTGKARSFEELGRAVFSAMGVQPKIRYIEMPEKLRERYQYFTQARMEKLRGEGYLKAFTPLEEGVRLTIERLSSKS